MPRAAAEFVQCPFRIVVDSREQRPFAFNRLRTDAKQNRLPLRIETVVRGLPTGDYSIDGLESRIALERKALGDLFSTLGQSRSRFERELERLAALDFAAVVIEAEWSEILSASPPRSELNPKTIIRSVMAWQVRWPRVHWWTVPGRDVAEHVTFRLLDRFWREQQAKVKGELTCTTAPNADKPATVMAT